MWLSSSRMYSLADSSIAPRIIRPNERAATVESNPERKGDSGEGPMRVGPFFYSFAQRFLVRARYRTRMRRLMAMASATQACAQAVDFLPTS